MSIGGKIRFLLFLMGICCLATAMSLNNAVTKQDLLLREARKLQENLAAKEQIVQGFLNTSVQQAKLKSLAKGTKQALNFLAIYPDQGINLLVFQNNSLVFWSAATVFPIDVNTIKEGSSFRQLPNGWYELIKKTTSTHIFVFLIEIKKQFAIENQYLKNQISPTLFSEQTLALAAFSDKNIVDIFNTDKQFLFAVKLSPSLSDKTYASTQIWLWLIGLFGICLFVNSYCSMLAKKGFISSATFLLAIFFIALRLSDLNFFWFNHQFDLKIFSPAIYAESDFLPSLGDLLLNVIAITWVCIFAYTHRFKYRLPKWLSENKTVGVLFQVMLLLIIAYTAFLIDDVFFGLIYNSKINFDITNIINLDWISWLCILILCLVWFILYVIVNVFIVLTNQLKSTNSSRLIIFLVLLACFFIYKLLTGFNVFFLVYALLIFVIGWNNYIQQRKFSFRVFAVVFLCMAFLTSIKYIKFIGIKERATRSAIASGLLNVDDPKVINSIKTFETEITSDSLVKAYFNKAAPSNSFVFENYIIKKYLDGYLSRFSFKIYEYNSQDSILNTEKIIKFSKYQELVKSGSVKTSETNYSYRINDTFGFQNYFSILPIFDGKALLGKLVIELKSQSYDYNSRFPEVLISGKLKSDEDFSNYSFAYYKNNILLNQSGRYTYPMVNKALKGTVGKVSFFNDAANFSHAVYKPDQSKTIVMSLEKVSYVERMATLSFFFLVFVIFGIGLYLFVWLVKKIDENSFHWFSFLRYTFINTNKILYKTRIQLSVVLSVVATLLIVGWATFFFIKNEYLKQQKSAMQEKLRKVQLSYEKQILNTEGLKNDEQAQYEFNRIADVNAAFLNLYDLDGNLFLTSLPKIYEAGLRGKIMNPDAFINLKLMQKSEYLNMKELIGDFKYTNAYAPIKNFNNQTVAYLGVPFYTNEADYQSKIEIFINTLINIYALVFVLVGVLAIFLANQITNPLTFIQNSISKTKLGQKNQPIVWHRQDEIGSLIKEYNKMIAELELSANKLARSERESAWREMAKQVAHEIKNPLTPLKLGVQLLEKSWKENDPNFAKKFESFNKSFIEQIDSLATIASEFSSFAKMPDTKLEKLQLLPLIDQAVAFFNSADSVEIMVLNRTNKDVTVLADKDQLMRSFNNLFKNAIEACEGKNKCAIKIKLINDEKSVYVEVEDNGKGIDQAINDKIFVPNFTTKSSGTGLGLAFVKQAIENAGGQIDYESRAKLGTTFFLTFPLV